MLKTFFRKAESLFLSLFYFLESSPLLLEDVGVLLGEARDSGLDASGGGSALEKKKTVTLTQLTFAFPFAHAANFRVQSFHVLAERGVGTEDIEDSLDPHRPHEVDVEYHDGRHDHVHEDVQVVMLADIQSVPACISLAGFFHLSPKSPTYDSKMAPTLGPRAFE